MQSLQQVKAASAKFVERKYLRLLTQHLEDSGTLNYVAPDRLRMVTEHPAWETFDLTGDNVTGIQRNGHRYALTLSEHPEIAALVEGIRSTLAGDLPTLQRYYTVDFRGDRTNWRLGLKPTSQSVSRNVDRIFISGVDTTLTRVEVRERDGDRSEMFITPDGS